MGAVFIGFSPKDFFLKLSPKNTELMIPPPSVVELFEAYWFCAPFTIVTLELFGMDTPLEVTLTCWAFVGLTFNDT